MHAHTYNTSVFSIALETFCNFSGMDIKWRDKNLSSFIKYLHLVLQRVWNDM